MACSQTTAIQCDMDLDVAEPQKFDDDEDEQTWQHMTEEEESLAQEEESLQKEIEEERKSIDLEVSRRTSIDESNGKVEDRVALDENHVGSNLQIFLCRTRSCIYAGQDIHGVQPYWRSACAVGRETHDVAGTGSQMERFEFCFR